MWRSTLRARRGGAGRAIFRLFVPYVLASRGAAGRGGVEGGGGRHGHTGPHALPLSVRYPRAPRKLSEWREIPTACATLLLA